MTWTRPTADTIECPPWSIRKGWLIGGTCYRLFNRNRLIAICPSAESAMKLADRGV